MQTRCDIGDEVFLKGTVCKIEVDEDNCVAYRIKVHTDFSDIALWATDSELFKVNNKQGANKDGNEA